MTKETAMKILKELHDKSLFAERTAIETIIPELKESEDEEIRKALIEMVHDTTGDELWVDYNVHKEEALAWLEKQGEQKPTESPKDYHDIDPHFGILADNIKPNLLTVERAKEISPFMRSGFENESTDKVEPKFKVGDWITIKE